MLRTVLCGSLLLVSLLYFLTLYFNDLPAELQTPSYGKIALGFGALLISITGLSTEYWMNSVQIAFHRTILSSIILFLAIVLFAGLWV